MLELLVDHLLFQHAFAGSLVGQRQATSSKAALGDETVLTCKGVLNNSGI